MILVSLSDHSESLQSHVTDIKIHLIKLKKIFFNSYTLSACRDDYLLIKLRSRHKRRVSRNARDIFEV